MNPPLSFRVLPDAAFTIGQQHVDNAKPCQDYALASDIAPPDGLGWAAISDGCSSGGLTDVGARMWVHAVRRVLQELKPEARDLLANQHSLKAALSASATPLLSAFSRNDALATLAMAAADGKSAWAAVFGDGVIAARDRNGLTTVWAVEYELNAPRYLSYELPRQDGTHDLDAWRAMVGASTVKVTRSSFEGQGSAQVLDQQTFAAAEYEGLHLSWPEATELECLAVVSDGVDSIPGVSTAECVRQLLAVKSPVGQFMHRRLGAMARGWKKGYSPMPLDDLAVGLLWFSPVEEPLND